MAKIPPLIDIDGTYLFPPIEHALTSPNGLLAWGGDLAPETLLNAYSLGIFPWYSQDDPILWWSPDPRMVLYPDNFHVSRSFRRTLNQFAGDITFDQHFELVIDECAAPRPNRESTWITDEMRSAYSTLHKLGYAHSLEVQADGVLIGGLYGVALGGIFFAESMFSAQANASKIALYHLCQMLKQHQFFLIDCQVFSPHLQSLGAELIPRALFKQALQTHIQERNYS